RILVLLSISRRLRTGVRCESAARGVARWPTPLSCHPVDRYEVRGSGREW
ncbi:zf-CCHC domain-containing protein/RVP_2 domain-containing protein, partial [Cephalotus follicularis]